MIFNIQFIILHEFQPPSLTQIQIFLRKYILQTLVVRKYLTRLTIKIMTPYFQSKYYRGQLQIMRRIILLIWL
ncbi:hypothetical protein AJ87_48840 [Rhizobium yanglingense]|nr:hypothetical protein AJ87_48840 [Rhizobium yanglingense]